MLPLSKELSLPIYLFFYLSFSLGVITSSIYSLLKKTKNDKTK
ncbi:hypothetical protein OA264_00795 [Alphaproteobacteria bacterium]|nr:hypothetical protein [Alphaproteobacteria bacterium]